MEILGAVHSIHRDGLTRLGRFCNASTVEYIDYGKSEKYRITNMKGEVLVINIDGDRSGAYANFVEEL